MIALTILLLLPTLVFTGPLTTDDERLERSLRSSGACSHDSITCIIQNVGRPINLGDGWDVRRGMAVSGSSPWYRATIDSKKENTSTGGFKEVVLEQELNSEERGQRLGVNADMQVNVLSGLVQVEAGGKYLTDQKEYSTSLRFLINYDSMSHEVQIPHGETPVDNADFCSSDHLAKSGGPTHVITSVQYGTKAFILFEREMHRQEEEKDVSVWMGTAISQWAVDVNTSVETNWTGKWDYSSSEIRLHFLGNTNDVNSPTTMEEIDVCISDLNKSSRDNPQPRSFTLTRIDEICKAEDVVFSSIENPILDKVAKILRNLADNELRSTTLLRSEIMQRDVLKEALDKKYINSYGSKLNEFQAELKGRFLNLLVDVRSKNADDTELEMVINEVENGPFGESKSGLFLTYLEEQIASFDPFYDVLNVQVDDHQGKIQSKCLTNGKVTYIFFLNVLPRSNLFEEFFEDKINYNVEWIQDEFIVTSKFGQIRRKAAISNPQATCFLVNFAQYNSTHPVTFRVMGNGIDATDHETLPEISERQITIDKQSCHWVDAGTYGAEAECAEKELATGACAGGSGTDCNNKQAVHRLRCCKADKDVVNTTSCETIESGYGKNVDCFARTDPGIVHKSCSSGRYKDCKGESGKNFNVVDCCTTGLANGAIPVRPRGGQDCGQWKYGTWGEDLECDDDTVLVARCGSGFRKNCPQTSSHGIRCCKIFALLD